MDRLESRITSGALFVAIGLVVLLSFQVRILRRENSFLEERNNTLPVGTFAPLIQAPTLNGDSVLLGRTNSKGFVYFVYNVECQHCKKSIPAWNALGERVKALSGIDILGISLDSEVDTRQYHREHSLQFESVFLQNPRSIDVHRFWAVPQTLVLDGEGQVVLSRLGVLEDGPATDSVFLAVESVIDSGPAQPQG